MYREQKPRLGSQIFTSEPQLTRAVAAEIRHAPEAVERFIGAVLKKDIGRLIEVGCEKEERIDILLSFSGETRIRKVAIEAKVDHVVSSEQIERQSTVCDDVILLVLEAEDAAAYRDEVAGVVTWNELLSIFDQPRLRLDDVESLPAQKVQVERLLRDALARYVVPEGWSLYVDRGDSAMPGITIISPSHPINGQLCGQIQVTGRKMPDRLNDVMIEFYAGTHVEETEECFPSPETTPPPQWVNNARILYSEVLRGNPAAFNLKTRAPGMSRRPLGKHRKELTKKYLSDYPWLAQGYIDWSIGVRAYAQPLGSIDGVLDTAMRLFTSWFDALGNE
ncbi:hypothetical protein [Corynebacterium sp. TAE3-ERU2]|uniref:hypothetical protein n=1 Tax=Corynebacterium sp. TAE3-ERU2 TaxID=2849497 RepID=UPI001C4897BD|nr:hypothetical protein [Corynebacterium sp. TAE3-ERU2]MBV7302688.1 hypothetical protein [Corynebacterium sp. TAE3-ERU2]